MRELPERIPIHDCQHGHLYCTYSRNLNLGVFRAEDNGFVGIRLKFDRRYPLFPTGSVEDLVDWIVGHFKWGCRELLVVERLPGETVLLRRDEEGLVLIAAGGVQVLSITVDAQIPTVGQPLFDLLPRRAIVAAADRVLVAA